MEEIIYQADLNKAVGLIKQCQAKYSPQEALAWLDNKTKQIHEQESDKLYFITFSEVPHHFGKQPITYTKEELEQANAIRKDWNPRNWNLTQLTRTRLILDYALHRPEHFKEAMDKIFNAADTYEFITLYAALPLFPNPEKFLLHATNGIRNNMVSVIESIILNNPYPADYFNQTAWNQLVLKALFVSSPIDKIIGLKRRANTELGTALINTVRERHAAERDILLDIWCLIGFCADKAMISTLKELASTNDPILLNGAILACDHSDLPEAKEFFNQNQSKLTDKKALEALRDFEKRLVK